MKTKIIYISGNELFDMADIRAAFDEVRAALSLDSDTILFGVPVDNDDALSEPETITPVVTPIPEPVIEEIAEPVEEESEQETIKPERKRAKVVPIFDTIKPHEQKITEPETTEAPVVHISSVLTTGDSKPEKMDIDEPESEHIDIDIASISEPVAETNEVELDAETADISGMIGDDAPSEVHEKTLEELLESMTPLGEDIEKDNGPIAAPEEPKLDTAPDADTESEDIDITLEKLATEFVENQDKIETPTKPASRGKIGKLKNILPFKKVKHDDSSLMGDLFGWAGVAANDEDFSIPGFFTTAASKK